MPPSGDTHDQILARMDVLDSRITELETAAKGVIAAFAAAQGAFTVLETIGRLAKPLAWLTTMAAIAGFAWMELKRRLFGG